MHGSLAISLSLPMQVASSEQRWQPSVTLILEISTEHPKQTSEKTADFE